MTKFSITKLEEARANPIAFAKLLAKGEAQTRGFAYPKSLRWLNAVNAFHKSGKIADAYLSIDQAFGGRRETAQNRRELEAFYNALAAYETYLGQEGLHRLNSREKIDLELNRKLGMSGIIPLVFMKAAGGYAAYFISKVNLDWRNELKYPIIQTYLSERVFNTDPQSTEVGYIDFLTGEFHGECFSKTELKNAQAELRKLGTKISKII